MGLINQFLLQFLIISTLLLSCSNMNETNSYLNAPPKPIRMLSLGDSYTIGTSVDVEERFPAQVIALLRHRGFEVTEIELVAQNGWTSGELLAGIRSSSVQGLFDFVTLLIGVNNQFRDYDPHEYQQDFRELLRIAIVFAGGRPERVVVLSIPDWGATPFARGMDREQISQDIDLFNQIKRFETQAVGAQYVDVTLLSRDVHDDPSLMAEDGLHLSGKMYSMWAELVVEIILPTLQS